MLREHTHIHTSNSNNRSSNSTWVNKNYCTPLRLFSCHTRNGEDTQLVFCMQPKTKQENSKRNSKFFAIHLSAFVCPHLDEMELSGGPCVMTMYCHLLSGINCCINSNSNGYARDRASYRMIVNSLKRNNTWL